MNNRELWEKIKTDWPDLRDFILQLKQAGIDVKPPQVRVWPNESVDATENIQKMRETLND